METLAKEANDYYILDSHSELVYSRVDPHTEQAKSLVRHVQHERVGDGFAGRVVFARVAAGIIGGLATAAVGRRTQIQP